MTPLGRLTPPTPCGCRSARQSGSWLTLSDESVIVVHTRWDTMAKSSWPLFRSPSLDEERLIRLFRLADVSYRQDMLASLADEIAERLTRSPDHTAETEEEREDRVTEFLNQKASGTRPRDDDFLSNLSGNVVLEDLFSEGQLQFVVGESWSDSEQANALMDSYTAVTYDNPTLVGTDRYFSGDSPEESNEKLRESLEGTFQTWRFHFLESLEEAEWEWRRSGGNRVK